MEKQLYKQNTRFINEMYVILQAQQISYNHIVFHR